MQELCHHTNNRLPDLAALRRRVPTSASPPRAAAERGGGIVLSDAATPSTAARFTMAPILS
jgi:hypothetical protein